VPVRQRSQQPQSAGSAAMAARPVGGGPNLVDEHQVGGIERGLAAHEDPPLLGYVGAILLGGVQALFLSVMFCARRNRHKLVNPTLIPCPAASAPRISCTVRSGGVATNATTAVRCSSKRERWSPPIARGWA
jgi:hypothetical protein